MPPRPLSQCRLTRSVNSIKNCRATAPTRRTERPMTELDYLQFHLPTPFPHPFAYSCPYGQPCPGIMPWLRYTSCRTNSLSSQLREKCICLFYFCSVFFLFFLYFPLIFTPTFQQLPSSYNFALMLDYGLNYDYSAEREIYAV